MKSTVFTLACLVWLSLYPFASSAQTTTVYGRPGVIHPDGDLTCSDNDKVCAVIQQPAPTYRTANGVLSDDAARKTNVTVFTANGPVTFDAASTFQITNSAQGRKVYRFKKEGPTKRVVYTN